MAQGEKIVKERYGIMAPFVLEALKKRGYEAYFCETAEEASQLALSLMPLRRLWEAEKESPGV